MNSMLLHELYFDSLGATDLSPGALRAAFERAFGNRDGWSTQFNAMGEAQGGGSGWVLLTWPPHNRRLVNQWAADQICALAGAYPLLALEMYEHSDHIDCGAKAAADVDAFLPSINWAGATQRLAAVSP